MAPIDSTASGDMIPLCVPEIRGNEWDYIKECLDTNWVSSAGKYVERFETMIAAYTGAERAVACVNGTSALHLAMLIAGVEPGDEVLVSTLTFIAPANAIRYAGAHPIFVDAEPDTWQMDPALVVDFLENTCENRGDEGLINLETGRRIGAIIPVHILGHPVNLNPIIEVADRFNIPVVEDASESLGATYRGRRVGGIGDVGCFSFNGNKMLTTGGGGMLVTSDPEMAERAKYLSTQAKDDPIEYVHYEVGYNYRLTNIQAAMGCAQLEQLEDYVTKKREIARRYNEAFAGLPGVSGMLEAEWAHHDRWLYTIRLEESEAGMNRRQLAAELAQRKVQTRPLWQPMHLSPAHRGCLSLGGEVAESLQREALCLPCSVGLTDEQQRQVINAIRTSLGHR